MIVIMALAAISLFLITATVVYRKTAEKERAEIMRLAESVCARVKVYCAHKSINSPHTGAMELSLKEELKKFWDFLSRCEDLRLAKEAEAAMRGFINKTARISFNTFRAKV